MGGLIRFMTNLHLQVVTQKITDAHAGQRLDNYLLRYLKGVPKSLVYKIIRRGEVRVNKKRVKPEYKLQINDLLRIPPVKVAEPSAPSKISDDLKNKLIKAIVHQDEDFIVINKPSGMAVHGGSGLSFGLIEGMRLALELPNLELVHRLDRETSGCLLIAKKRQALVKAHQALRDKQVRKRYLAVLTDSWCGEKQKTVTVPLLKNTLQGGERIVEVSPEGKAAKTMFQLVENAENCCLVRAYPVTGRTHQIRVHAQYLGLPIMGDPKYKPRDKGKKHHIKVSRLLLHAEQLSFSIDGKPYFFKVAVDEQWRDCLSALGFVNI
jgi:23S rRNA pseudouridine955/2504/2580 synthase